MILGHKLLDSTVRFEYPGRLSQEKQKKTSDIDLWWSTNNSDIGKLKGDSADCTTWERGQWDRILQHFLYSYLFY